MMKSTLNFYRKQFFALALLLVGAVSLWVTNAAAQNHPEANTYLQIHKNDGGFTGFETRLDIIRQTLNIPGMSAAVVQDQELVWSSGFGYADLENQVPAAPETPYGLASVTKPVAAVLIMQLVEEGLVDLDAPVSDYGVDLVGDTVTVRHLMTHTSEGIPGTKHNYNGSRYGHLGGVIEGATSKSFAENLSERILLPLAMNSTALNPINFWGGSNFSGWRDFQLALGWGEGFAHYPDVYSRLAKPYQFDDQFNLIPGMYHLYHNPAAGMLSSVEDLAKFDIALDQGLLLGEVAKEEMFAPAVSTYNNRPDLSYGLGWYVQDFDGEQFLWHSGRWPPSTSALYLKIPEENLTFIVLANTASLTTPFDSIGYGDISKSLLAISFYNYFVFPEKYGAELPVIDWGAPENHIVDQLLQIDDQAVLDFSERELWAFRQAYAAAGQQDQVEKLRRVNLRAFSNPAMRRDGFYTFTVGAFPVVQPGLSAAVFTWLTWGILAWIILVTGSIVLIVFLLIRQGVSVRRWWIYWLLSTVFLGPISLLVYIRFHSPSGKLALSENGLAWILSMFLTGIFTLGWAVAFSLLVRIGEQPHPLVTLGICYLTPLISSFVFFWTPSLLSWGADYRGTRFWASLKLAIIHMNITLAVLFPLTFIFNHLLSTIPGGFNLFYWAVLSLLSIANLLAQYPITRWLIRRGSLPWNPEIAPYQGSYSPHVMKSTWPVFTASLVIMIGLLTVTIWQLG